MHLINHLADKTQALKSLTELTTESVKLTSHPFYLLLLWSIFLLTSCDSSGHNPSGMAQEEVAATIEIIDGFDIPLFNTGAKQLNYARAHFDTDKEKLAALRAVSLLFPEATKETGVAALEIAYLQLGSDYRAADKAQCQLALSLYNEISVEFDKFPEISAKALWYKGWIAAELLDQPNEGLSYFQQIIIDYPQARIAPKPPPPWISIYQEAETRKHIPFLTTSTISWPDMARLEIIRHTQDRQQAYETLLGLHGQAPNDYLFVPSIKLFVKRFGLHNHIELMVRSYLQSEEATELQKADLQSTLTDNDV